MKKKSKSNCIINADFKVLVFQTRMRTPVKACPQLLAANTMAGLQGMSVANAELCGGVEVGEEPGGEAPSG